MVPIKSYQPIDLSAIRTVPLGQRANKADLADLARPPRPGLSFAEFVAGLPGQLAADDFRAVVQAIVTAHRGGRPIIWAMGAHVVKCGLSLVLADLMQRGLISALALNGAGAIHDFELALVGGTSEDVVRGLEDGSFGMAEETGRLFNEAIAGVPSDGAGTGRREVLPPLPGVGEGAGGEASPLPGVGEGVGGEASPRRRMGWLLGEQLERVAAPNRQFSLLWWGHQLGVPVTVHVAIGTDIVHMHPSMDGAAVGAATFEDFRLLAGVVAELGHGGVYLNVGSAVVLPEVFLKALTVARNLGHEVVDFTAVNLDMIQHYRSVTNVVRRPTLGHGRGYILTGHHELLVPLLAQAVVDEVGSGQ